MQDYLSFNGRAMKQDYNSPMNGNTGNLNIVTWQDQLPQQPVWYPSICNSKELGKVNLSCDMCTNKFNTQNCTLSLQDWQLPSHFEHNLQNFHTNSSYRNNIATGYSYCMIILFPTAGLYPLYDDFQIFMYVL